MSDKMRDLTGAALHLLRPFRVLAACGAGLGIFSGLATAGLLATINRSLHEPADTSVELLLSFVGLGLLSVGGTAMSGTLNSIIGQKVISALRKDISARILNAPIAALEAKRPYRLMAVLTNDVDTVSAFTFNFSGYAIAVAITLGSFLYLLSLSPIAFGIAFVSLGLGIAINMIAKRGWIRDYEDVRLAQDTLQKQYRAIIDGAKELKISRERRQRVHGILLSNAADQIASLKSRAMRLFWMADAVGSAIFFSAIGFILASRHGFDIGPGVISGAVIILLYVKGPVEQIAAALPILDQARVSFRRIAELSMSLDQHQRTVPENATPLAAPRRAITLKDVRYAFSSPSGGSGFALGPINLTIRCGETVFIVGENGSGKTTLIKLLLGLYAPSSGQLLLDDLPLAPDRLDDYRQLFSAVFSDYFLFDDLLSAGADLADRAEAYLTRLEIAHQTRIQDGAFTTIDLSTGQRKRLALVHAYLENRPILMFDEWAADQDPTFRRVFYREVLPELRRQGKTLIVVSHDDRFFDAADRVIRLEAGRIVEDRAVTADRIDGTPEL